MKKRDAKSKERDLLFTVYLLYIHFDVSHVSILFYKYFSKVATAK